MVRLPIAQIACKCTTFYKQRYGKVGRILNAPNSFLTHTPCELRHNYHLNLIYSVDIANINPDTFHIIY